MASLRWSFDVRAHAYRDGTTGRFLTNKTILDLRDGLLDSRVGATKALSSALADGRIDLPGWQSGMRAVSKDTAVAEYLFGRGGINAMTQADYGRVGALVKEQYTFLRGFAQDIADGKLSETQIEARAAMYAHAGVQAHSVGQEASYGGRLSLPAHPGSAECLSRCVPAGTMTESTLLLSGYERWYDGEMMMLRTRGGRVLSITPNHPVLTDRGWVAAGALVVGDKLISGSLDKRLGWSDPDIDHTPALIEQVVGTLRDVGHTERVMGSGLDFHGDGRDSEVDVVWADRLLMDRAKATLQEPAFQHILSCSNFLRAGQLLHQRLSGLVGGGMLASAAGIVRGSTEALSFLGGEPGHAEQHRVPAVAGVDVSRQQVAANRSTGQSVSAGQRQLAFAGGVPGDHVGRIEVEKTARSLMAQGHTFLAQSLSNDAPSDTELEAQLAYILATDIAADDLVSVERQAFHGMVYNLETATGWYCANGIIIHNCRCYWRIQEGPEAWICTWVSAGDGRTCEGCRSRASSFNPFVQSKVNLRVVA